MPTLNFEEEPLEQLKQRFGKALEDTYGEDSHPRPGELRQHVFDFGNGLRLIVSFDQFTGAKRLHVSASVVGGSVLYEEVKKLKHEARMKAFFSCAITGFNSISSQSCRLEFVVLTEGVVHWVGPTRKEWMSVC